MVQAHVYEFLSLGSSAEGSFTNGLRPAYESHDSSVGSIAGVHVEDFYAIDGGNRRHDGIDHRQVPAFAVIRYTFDDSFHPHV